MPLVFNSRNAFTALVAAFIIHNFEEAFAICRFPVDNPFPFIHPATCKQFLLSVSILTAAGLGAYIYAMRTTKPVIYNLISTGLAAALLLNSFVPHLFTGIYTVHYTPGLISAVVLNLPLSILALTKNRRQYTDSKTFFKHILVFLLIGYLLFALSMGFAKNYA